MQRNNHSGSVGEWANGRFHGGFPPPPPRPSSTAAAALSVDRHLSAEAEPTESTPLRPPLPLPNMDPQTMHVLKKVVIDFVCLMTVAVPVLIFKLFGEPYKRGFFCNDETIRYPFKPSTVTNIILYTFGIFLPSTMILFFETMLSRNKKNEPAMYIAGRKLPLWSINCYKSIGVFLFGVASTQLITDIGKYSIGRLRPHFIDICSPDIDCSKPIYQNVYITDFSCQKTDMKLLKESRLSFPSGHSSFSAYTMVYLAIYLHCKLRWRGSYLIKHLIQVCLILMSWFTALSRVSDYKHHWSDVTAGLIIGTTVAIVNARYVSGMCNKEFSMRSYSETSNLTNMDKRGPTIEL